MKMWTQEPTCPRCGATRHAPGPGAIYLVKMGYVGMTSAGVGNAPGGVRKFDELPDGTTEYICLDCGQVFDDRGHAVPLGGAFE